MAHVRILPLILMTIAIGAGARQGLAADGSPSPSQQVAGSDEIRFFETKIRPLLAENCFKCHGAEKQEENLRLDSRAAVLTGGDRGPAVVPGKPDGSLLIKAIKHLDDLEMPPKKQLSREQIADLTLWIKSGAVWPDDGAPATATRRSGYQVTDKDRAHWAFQPVKRPAIPAVKNSAWVANPIDAFVLAKLEAKNLQPNPPAGKRELVRRLYYDLTGLPPTPAEVEAFVADPSPAAYEALVDRLLFSPHYGEKWGRHWLDLVRYAESNSYERDDPKPHAWRYRDYVIRSFNEDKAFDRFIREQLAGDELPDADDDGLIATGFYRLGIWDDEPSDPDLARFDGLDDIVATTGQVFLGLTVDCARCHDHKIDPLPQKDYYRLLSFFAGVNHYRNGGPTDELALSGNTAAAEDREQLSRELEQKRTHLQESIAALEARFRREYLSGKKDTTASPATADPKGEKIVNGHGGNAGPPADFDLASIIKTDGERVLGTAEFKRYQYLQGRLEALKSETTPAGAALGVTEAGPTSPETFVLLRGNPHNRGDKVEPAFPEVLKGEKPVLPTPGPGAKSSGRRLALANWLASEANPLTPRVIVNRLWQYHFGRGIVRSPNNFGTQGEKPTHPELLDWLAAEFVSNGWRMKPLHRLIVTSNAYRMSSRANPQSLAADPMDDLFWRFEMRRLTAEEIRDSILAIGGTLNLKMFGPPVYPEIPKEVLAGQSRPGVGWGHSPPEEQARRSIYVHVKRSLLLPILEAFDLPETDRSSPVRFSTTQPTQALGMLNSGFLNEEAGFFAARVRREAGSDTAAQVKLALNLATARPPERREIERGVQLIQLLKRRGDDDAALRYFCLMVLNMNEFVYLD
jgi:mono/diheme cytochrome c family protein